MFPTKIRQLIEDIKQFCREQLWLAGILVLLLSIAALGVFRWSSDHSTRHLDKTDDAYVAVQVQISSEELLRIVSLSLTELLDMEVYIKLGSELLRKDPVMMSIASEKWVFSMHAQEAMLLNRSRRSRANVLISKQNRNTNNNEAVAELT